MPVLLALALLLAGCASKSNNAQPAPTAAGSARPIVAAATTAVNLAPTPSPVATRVSPVAGACPYGYSVKVTATKGVYPLDDPSYGSVQAVACYPSVAAALADGNHLNAATIVASNRACPAEQPVKVTASKAIYAPTHPAYATTAAATCYASVEAAIADGNHGATVGDGGCPVEMPVKVTADKVIYGTDLPSYGAVQAVACYDSTDDAIKDGNTLPAAAVTPAATR
jgi:hypothetical protein